MINMKMKYIPLVVLGLILVLFMNISTFLVIANNFDWQVVLHTLEYSIIPCLLIFLIDYVIISLLKKVLRKHPVLGFLLDVVCTSLMTSLIITIEGRLLFSFMYPNRTVDLLRLIVPAIFSNVLFVLLIELYIYYANKRIAEQRAIEAERKKAHYQFLALKNQMNPHFLFNSMNVLSSLIYQDADKANVFTKKLSAVYRYLLGTDKHITVTLAEELEFVNNYIYLQKIRFGESIQVEYAIPEEAMQRTVIPASIQVLVENAIKHNRCTVDTPLHISIVYQKGIITVTNNLQLRYDVVKSGIGLKNLAMQYELQGKKIVVHQNAESFSVSLYLPERTCESKIMSSMYHHHQL